eukprot:941047-Amphidinium_carterae.1
MRENERIRVDLVASERAEDAQQSELAAGMAWVHEQGGNAMRAISAVKTEAEQERQRALYLQSEEFLAQYRGCMRAQEEAAEVIGRLRSEKTSNDTAYQREQKVAADLRSELASASSVLATVREELASSQRQLGRAVKQRDELAEQNSRGNQ